jgi:hypothetical protein
MDKGNVNKHRQSMSGMKGVVEESKWGHAKAIERYGKLDQVNTRPKDMSYPQDPLDKRGPDWRDDAPNNWIRGKGENGKPPNFDRAYRPKGK